jgi:hypothetical protein
VVERLDPAVWLPAEVPAARLLPEAGSAVSATVAWGPTGSVPVRPSWVVDGLVGNHGLRVRDLALNAESDLAGLHLWSPNRRDLLVPVTGFTAPNLLWAARVLVEGSAVRSTENPQVVQDAARAWGRDALVGHNFIWDVFNLRIVASGGARLSFDSVVACTSCDPYRVETRLAALFVAGSPVMLASPWLHYTPAAPLSGGPVTLEIAGGRDRDGLPLYDGQRDGDEEAGTPDDRVTYLLTTP